MVAIATESVLLYIVTLVLMLYYQGWFLWWECCYRDGRQFDIMGATLLLWQQAGCWSNKSFVVIIVTEVIISEFSTRKLKYWNWKYPLKLIAVASILPNSVKYLSIFCLVRTVRQIIELIWTCNIEYLGQEAVKVSKSKKMRGSKLHPLMFR